MIAPETDTLVTYVRANRERYVDELFETARDHPAVAAAARAMEHETMTYLYTELAHALAM
jgi:hypothetical protein